MEEYSTKDIARLTDMAESTVRKYALLLEKNNYHFVRNASGNRIFTEMDIKIFLELKTTPKEEKPIEKIASDIASKYIAKIITSKLDKTDDIQLHQGFDPAMLAILTKKIDELTDMQQKQLEFNQVLIKKLDQQQAYIDGRLEERDRKLLRSLRQTQEEKNVIAEVATTQEKKKGFFARMFGRE